MPTFETIMGKHPVLEAIRAGRSIVEINIAEGTQASQQEVLRLAGDEGIPVKVVPKKVVEERARGQVHQGVLAFVKARSFFSLDELLEVARSKSEPPLLVAVDGIEDPQNLGAILRSAVAAGAHGVVLATRGTTTVTPAVVKASAGASEHLKVARVPSLPNALLDLQRKKVWIGGTDPRDGMPYYEADLTGPLVLVIGNEASGMSPLVANRCDFLVRIPMKGPVDSLNAGAACAVVLMERLRQLASPSPENRARGPRESGSS